MRNAMKIGHERIKELQEPGTTLLYSVKYPTIAVRLFNCWEVTTPDLQTHHVNELPKTWDGAILIRYAQTPHEWYNRYSSRKET